MPNTDINVDILRSTRGKRLDPLFSVPTSDAQMAHQRLWYVLSCLWESTYKAPLLLIGKSSLCEDGGFPLKKYVTEICLRQIADDMKIHVL